MDAILRGSPTRDAELTAIARLVVYAQGAARDLGAIEVEAHLANSLGAIVRELEGTSDQAELPMGASTAPVLATCQ